MLLVPVALLWLLAGVVRGQGAPKVSLMEVGEMAADASFNDISGLAVDPSGQEPVFYAVSDDFRDAVTDNEDLKAPFSGRRYFDFSAAFYPKFNPKAMPRTTFPIPEQGEKTRPEGLAFSGGVLYMADNVPAVSSGEPKAFNSRIRSFVPEADSFKDLFQVPLSVPQEFQFEGVAVSEAVEGQPMLYYLVGAPFPWDPENFVVIGEIDINSKELRRGFFYEVEAGARAMEVVWESEGRFLVLEAEGGNLGEEPTLPAPASGLTPNPSRMALYQISLPAADSEQSKQLNIVPGRQDVIAAYGKDPNSPKPKQKAVPKVFLGAFTLEDREGQEVMVWKNAQDEEQVVKPVAGSVSEWDGFLPMWDAMEFAPRAPGSAGPRTLYMISDNNVCNIPTRYASLSYTPQ